MPRISTRSLPAAVLPWVFVIGLAAGAMLPPAWRWTGADSSRAAATQVSRAHPAPSEEGAVWSRAGNPDVRHRVEVLRTLDGDTFEARVHLWPGLDMTTRVRLRGIDAPELKASCPQEREMAEAAGAALRALLAGGGVAIYNIGPDKYSGRVVADAATPQTPSVSATLLAAGHARRYGGGRRAGWCGMASR